MVLRINGFDVAGSGGGGGEWSLFLELYADDVTFNVSYIFKEYQSFIKQSLEYILRLPYPFVLFVPKFLSFDFVPKIEIHSIYNEA